MISIYYKNFEYLLSLIAVKLKFVFLILICYRRSNFQILVWNSKANNYNLVANLKHLIGTGTDLVLILL